MAYAIRSRRDGHSSGLQVGCYEDKLSLAARKEGKPMDTLPVEWLTLNAVYTLTSAVMAFRTSPEDQDEDSGGPLCELPEGAAVEVCGAGFSKRTVKVHYGDCYYHVYWRDLASANRAADQPPASGESTGLLRLAETLNELNQTKTVELSGLSKTNRD
jgi:hypothetical protein